MLSCDWCGRQIAGEEQTGYSFESVPFRPLDLGGRRDAAKDKKIIVAEMHLHEEPCREAFIGAARKLAMEHEPSEEELEYEHATTESTDDGKAEEKRLDERHSEWDKLPKHEQDRMALEALGEDRLTNRELGERLKEGDEPCPWLHSNDMAIVTRRLFIAGELARQHGQFGQSRIRYWRREPSDELKKLGEQLAGDTPKGQTVEPHPRRDSHPQEEI